MDLPAEMIEDINRVNGMVGSSVGESQVTRSEIEQHDEDNAWHLRPEKRSRFQRVDAEWKCLPPSKDGIGISEAEWHELRRLTKDGLLGCSDQASIDEVIKVIKSIKDEPEPSPLMGPQAAEVAVTDLEDEIEEISESCLSPELMEQIDTNQDGVISPEELMKQIDTNQDGVISPEEWNQVMKETPELVKVVLKRLNTNMQRKGLDAESFFEKLNCNEIGSISRKDFASHVAAPLALDANDVRTLFEYFDKDGDGAIDAEEFSAVMGVTPPPEQGNEETEVYDSCVDDLIWRVYGTGIFPYLAGYTACHMLALKVSQDSALVSAEPSPQIQAYVLQLWLSSLPFEMMLRKMLSVADLGNPAKEKEVLGLAEGVFDYLHQADLLQLPSKYTASSLLGAGSYSDTILVKDTTNGGALVVVKRCSKNKTPLLCNTDRLSRWMRRADLSVGNEECQQTFDSAMVEYRMMQRLQEHSEPENTFFMTCDDSNIEEAYAGTTQDAVYMQLSTPGPDAVNLREFRGSNTPTHAQLFHMSSQLMSMLQKLKRLDLVHFDISGGNLVYSKSQQNLMLVDYGGMTSVGTPRGYTMTKPGFAAPEFENGEWERLTGPPATTAYDVFSVAIVIVTIFYHEFCYDELWEEPPLWGEFYTNVLGYPEDPTTADGASPVDLAQFLEAGTAKMFDTLRHHEDNEEDTEGHAFLDEVMLRARTHPASFEGTLLRCVWKMLAHHPPSREQAAEELHAFFTNT